MRHLSTALLLVIALVATGSRAESSATAGTVPEPPFMDSFPNLKDYVFKEPDSGTFLGAGLSPVGILHNRTMFTANFFQIHVQSKNWEFEILNASYGVTRAATPIFQSNDFTFRTAVKFKLGHIFSIGPLVGYEFVNFPSLGAILFNGRLATPDESFSSQGIIYGGMVTETFHYRDYLIQINEVGFQETYGTHKTEEGWQYIYDNPQVQASPSLIGPSFVTELELSFLF